MKKARLSKILHRIAKFSRKRAGLSYVRCFVDKVRRIDSDIIRQHRKVFDLPEILVGLFFL